MKKQRFTMINLASREVKGNIKNIMEIISTVEINNYEEGRFQCGPTIVEFQPTDIGKEDQLFKVYIPINEEVIATGDDGVDWEWVYELDIPKVIRTRTPFEEGVESKLQDMKKYLQEHNMSYDDRLLLLFSKIYDEFWIDMVIPYV